MRGLAGRDSANHRADGMADEHRIPKLQLAADLDDVVGIAFKGGVSSLGKRAEVGPAGADVIKKNGPEPVPESGFDEAPHVLVAAEAMGEDHGARTFPGYSDVIPLHCSHR